MEHLNEFKNLINLQLMMFLLMGTGAFLRRIDLITKEGTKMLTDLVIGLILPCSIVSAFCIEFNREILNAGLTTLLISCGIQLLCILIAAFAYLKVPRKQRMIMQYGTVCPNSGILGNPLAAGIYGPMGMLYASLFSIPQRIVMWSVGVTYFTESSTKKELLKRVLTHPCVIACFLGLFLMITGIRFPVFVMKTIDSVGDCLMAVSMLFIGAVLAETDVKNLFSSNMLLYSAIRLVVIPLLTLIPCILLRLDPVAAGVCVLLAATPAGSTTAMLASKYNGDAGFATQCVFVTTMLSMILIPAWCLIVNAVL
ncbi:MAG: AEC family transporter [Lachnospiraceae bacterium]|nr:AEC family transporter [Lachnospiraceae bacterium]